VCCFWSKGLEVGQGDDDCAVKDFICNRLQQMGVSKSTGTQSGTKSSTQGVRSETVRRSNLSAILGMLRTAASVTRSELVEATGLTRSAVGSLIGELVEHGLVTEIGAQHDGHRGRPSAMAELDGAGLAALSFEIGVDGVAAAVVNLRGEVIDDARASRTRGPVPVEAKVDDLVTLANLLGYVDGAVGDRRIVGIGVAVAGTVTSDGKTVVMAPNLQWSDVQLADLVSARFGDGVAVTIGNDADVGALAEHRFGAGDGASDMIFVGGEIGIGGGIIVDGQRVHGRSGFAGEVGHMPVNPSGDVCGCGSIGCWETEVGERALLRRAGLDEDGGNAAVQRLLLAAQQGDAMVLDAFAEHGGWMAIGLACLINVFDPEIVVMGGMFNDVWHHVEDVVTSDLARTSFGGRARPGVVVAGRLGNSARLIGAAELAFQPLLDNPVSA
jgi:predicted NBD/HSP70 family sugar kinase